MESGLLQSTDHHPILMFRSIALFLTTLLMASPAFACHCTVHGESSASESSEQKSEQEQEQEQEQD